MKGRVLVIDDEKNMGLVIQAMLERAAFEVLLFSDAAAAIDAIEHEELDAVVTDLYMPTFGGLEILERVKLHQSQVPVVMITAFGTIESAVTALKKGAFDFITKPFDQSELLEVVAKACRTHRERMKEPEFDGAAPNSPAADSGHEGVPVIGTSSRELELRRQIERVATVDSPILIVGESGTGKELVAQEIHRRSARTERPIIKVNCAVIPAPLIESELFGYERGAFSGAVSSKPGRFELADEGTLFLDEVEELPLEVQAKLLRAIRDGEFERIGGLSTIRVNVRIIAATTRDLAAAVQAKTFREDLYYGLNVLPLAVPPLRERAEDIEAWVDYFRARFNIRLKKNVAYVDPAVMTALRNYRWPGNFRQLENVLERMVLLADSDTLAVRDLPEDLADSSGKNESDAENAIGFKETVRRKTQETERTLIELALDEAEGNVTRTAEKLGLSRKGLQLKMKELGIRR